MTELRYDSNPGIADIQQENTPDITLQVSPTFDLKRETGRLRLGLSYAPTGYYYFRDQNLNTLSHTGSISMSANLSPRDTFSAVDTMSYSLESLETTIIGLENGRNHVFTNTFHVGYDHRFTPRTSAGLSASDSIYNFDDPIATDSKADSASAVLSYQATRDTSVNGTYNFSYIKYNSPDGNSNEIISHSVSAGAATHYGENLHFSLSVGGTFAEEGGGFADWIAAADVTRKFQDSSLTLGYARTTTAATGLTNHLAINEIYNAEYTYWATKTVSARVFGSYNRNFSSHGGDLDVKSVYAGISGEWKAYQWLTLGLGYTHFVQRSDGSLGLDVDRDHIFVRANITTLERRF